MKSTLIPQQTNIEPHNQKWLLKYADEHDILKQDLWQRAINNLLAYRLKVIEKGETPRYSARSRGELVAWSVRLPHPLVERVKAAVEEDQTSVRLFYYTALLDFIGDHMESDE